MSDLMNDPMVLRQILMDHYEYPRNHELTHDETYYTRHMASDSCIDDIHVEAKIEDRIIKDIRFDGVACTIATAATSIMSELLRGKNIVMSLPFITFVISAENKYQSPCHALLALNFSRRPSLNYTMRY